MCGIAGFLSLDKNAEHEGRDIAARMAATLAHRGPDNQGVWADTQLPLFLAHRRLSIIDLSQNGHQPMASSCGRFVISYNGEIYNFGDMKRELESAGAKFRGHSDTEVLLAAFSLWGLAKALERIEGMFAFALWDIREKTLHLVRDRFGEKPLYVGWAGKKLAFASELRAFTTCPGFEKRLNPQACTALIRLLCIPCPLSIFENVWKLPPGHRLSVNYADLTKGEDLTLKMAPYWSAAEAFLTPAKGEHNDAFYLKSLQAALSDAVERRMVSDAPLGAFLSGGIDSSLIVSLMQKHASQPVKTFTIGFEEKHYDEAPYARAIAEYLGTEHTELYINADKVRGLIPDLPRIYDEPFAVPSQLPSYFLSQLASSKVKVALSGDGGDELFGGYHHHVLLGRIWGLIGPIPSFLRAGIGGIASRIPKSALKLLHKEQGYLYYKRFQTFGKFMGARKLFAAQMGLHGNHRTPYAFLKEDVKAPDLWMDHIVPEDTPRSEVLRHTLLGDLAFHLPEIVLGIADRSSMASSLEVRAPLLDRRILALAAELPDSLRIQNNQGKIILRRLLGEYLPAQYFERKKAGFNVPIEQWLMGPLRDWGYDLLTSTQFKDDELLDSAYVLKNWDELQRGNKEIGRAMWAILMLQAWRQNWMT